MFIRIINFHENGSASILPMALSENEAANLLLNHHFPFKIIPNIGKYTAVYLKPIFTLYVFCFLLLHSLFFPFFLYFVNHMFGFPKRYSDHVQYDLGRFTGRCTGRIRMDPLRHSHVTHDDVASNALKSLCDLQRVVVVSEANPLKDDKVG